MTRYRVAYDAGDALIANNDGEPFETTDRKEAEQMRDSAQTYFPDARVERVGPPRRRKTRKRRDLRRE